MKEYQSIDPQVYVYIHFVQYVILTNICIIIRLNHVIRGKSRDAWYASSECVLLETFSQRRIQHLPTLLLLLPMLMLPCSLYQPAALAAATPAGVGYGVEADGRRVAKTSAVFRSLARRCSSRVLLVKLYLH